MQVDADEQIAAASLFLHIYLALTSDFWYLLIAVE